MTMTRHTSARPLPKQWSKRRRMIETMDQGDTITCQKGYDWPGLVRRTNESNYNAGTGRQWICQTGEQFTITRTH